MDFSDKVIQDLTDYDTIKDAYFDKTGDNITIEVWGGPKFTISTSFIKEVEIGGRLFSPIKGIGAQDG